MTADFSLPMIAFAKTVFSSAAQCASFIGLSGAYCAQSDLNRSTKFLLDANSITTSFTPNGTPGMDCMNCASVSKAQDCISFSFIVDCLVYLYDLSVKKLAF